MLSEGFKRSVYFNKYKIIPNKTYYENYYVRELLDASYQGGTIAYRDRGDNNRVTSDSHRKYFLPRIKTENFNIEIDEKHFHDQPINDLLKQYDEVRKVSTGQDDDCTTVFLLDFAYFLNNYR